MRQFLVPALLWFSAIGCGVMAGVYFAFSGFVMSALARIDHAAGISAMNAINIVIVRSAFMPIFLATTLSSLALVPAAFFRWGEPGSLAMLAGGIAYVLGMFVVTAIFNVPLNDALAKVDATSAEAAAFWLRFVDSWTMWNHVRTIASTLACGLFIAALATG